MSYQKKMVGGIQMYHDTYKQEILLCSKNSSSDSETNEKGGYPIGAAAIKSRKHEDKHVSDCIKRKEEAPFRTGLSSSHKHRYLKGRTKIDLTPEERTGDVKSFQVENMPVTNFTSQRDKYSLPTQLRKKSRIKRSKTGHSHSKYSVDTNKGKSDEGSFIVDPFDICCSASGNSDILSASLNEKNKEKQIIEGNRQRVLRPGMVLLKHYITYDYQIKIVKTCQELGLGPGGFYRPGYKDGAKLRLQMMCLGLNWDTQTRKYENRRPIDGCEPPGIPHEFSFLVTRAIQDAHTLIERNFKPINVEDLLPAMSPNICIVNFYTNSGRLGLHQDRDESADSLQKGLPVVSFSIGDSAEFLYGDGRDVDKAKKVVLESGDVLIFGGKSRHIFHGVASIIPNSAPKALLEEARLRPGRLNLTFRHY